MSGEKTDKPISGHEPQPGRQEPTGGPGTGVSHEGTVTIDGRTFTAQQVAEDRARVIAENADYRKRLNAMDADLKKLQAGQEAAERDRAEKQGEFQKLYEQERSAYASFKSKAAEKLVRQTLERELVNAGVPKSMLKRLSISTDGLTVTDDFDVAGDLTAVVQGIVADLADVLPAAKPTNGASGPALPAQTPAPAKPTTVIGETSRTEAPAPRTFTAAEAARIIGDGLIKAGVAHG